jgi:hypothetical protein
MRQYYRLRECPNNANTLKDRYEELETGNNDYKNIPLDFARNARANA